MTSIDWRIGRDLKKKIYRVNQYLLLEELFQKSYKNLHLLSLSGLVCSKITSPPVQPSWKPPCTPHGSHTWTCSLPRAATPTPEAETECWRTGSTPCQSPGMVNTARTEAFHCLWMETSAHLCSRYESQRPGIFLKKKNKKQKKTTKNQFSLDISKLVLNGTQN